MRINKSGIFMVGLVVMTMGCLSNKVLAAELKWSGEYRAEGNYIKNFTLNNSNSGVEDSYLIQHLILSPEVIATDGLKIRSRFDVFNNALAGNTAGTIFGQYTGPTTTATGYQSPAAVLSQTQQPATIVVNALYMEWVNEFSSVTIGRVPFQFGLGMLYSNGEGPFDHALTNKDLVAYKVSLGNLTIMPAIGKVREGYLLNEDDINDYLAVVEYNNAESDLSLGVMFDQRIATQDNGSPLQGNDFPLSYFATPGVSPTNFSAAVKDPGGAGFNAYNMNFFVQKKSENFSIGVELGFTNGYAGIQVPNSDNVGGAADRVNLSGYGAATETSYKTGDWTFKLFAGVASGDDPDTANFEGYAFSSNYDIAMIMFNFPVGAPGYDALRSGIFGSRAPVNSTDPNAQALQGLDTEVITNAIYAAPQITWAIGERYDLIATFAWATQMEPSVSRSFNGTASQIGFETDLGFRYHPTKNFQWLTTGGAFLPGAAYAGQVGYPTSLAYGAVSKAAISF